MYWIKRILCLTFIVALRGSQKFPISHENWDPIMIDQPPAKIFCSGYAKKGIS